MVRKVEKFESNIQIFFSFFFYFLIFKMLFHANTDENYPIDIPYSFHQYNIIRLLGAGSTSIVVLVEDDISLKRYAAKIISKRNIKENHIENVVNNEIDILERLNHRNVVKMHKQFEYGGYIIIIMDYCENGDLLSYAMQKGFKSEYQMKNIMIGMLEAVEYLHSKGICHGDIKPENVLLDKDMNPKLSDFGYSKMKQIGGDHEKSGTLFYAAPELFKRGDFDTFKSDIYAVGISLYSIVELKFPFRDGSQKFIVRQIISGKLNISPRLSSSLKKLILRCTDMIPENRPSIKEVICDSYFDCSLHNSSIGKYDVNIIVPVQVESTQQLTSLI
ncbi:CAMK family protein kinase [Tritrichomonas foetus]|uniref:CAMK family protein kinase n=1 Tax=Tritrichomonas foetus TaxID=1144522 RepID=A0A1J4JY56_9EUKA|nr:CAMK family protein kinase [Tritrichomonas foetus]|eukprot:OHT03626.1 CAMK family protein kinase [Tritrichomonas foetus]